MADHKLRPGELTNDELNQLVGHTYERELPRAIATAAYEKAMKRAQFPLDPTPEMIEAGAQRLVRWETGDEKWPDAWSKLDVRAARNDAERCWRSMWLVAAAIEREAK